MTGAVAAARIRLPTPPQKLAVRRLCMQAQERRSLRGLTRTFGVSGAPVSSGITKKELSLLLYGLLCSPRTERIPRPHRRSWTYGGRVCSKKPTTPGCGWLSAQRADQWSPTRLGLGAGKTCQRLWEAVAEGYRAGHCETDFWAASRAVIRCRNTRWREAKRPEKRPRWSGGRTRCESRWLVLSACRSPFPSPRSCMRLACSSFSIALI